MGFLFLVVHSRHRPASLPPLLPHTQLTHTQLVHTQLAHTQLAQALGWLWWHAWFRFDAVVAAAVGVASVALGDIDFPFAWQAWHIVALMALGWLWWRAWFPFDAVVAAAVGVEGVALGDINLHCAWQA